ESARESAARAFLARPGVGLDADWVAETVAETLAILAHPDLEGLFGPEGRAEVPLTGRIGNTVVGGLVDRIAVTEEAVLLADFKTNRDPPERVEDTPLLYLTQMAAYRAILRAIFPGRDTRCALVWTRTGLVEILPGALLDRYQPPA
ncbi:MAG: PD-(D/E)XK nuclease family protein, partial [Acetobacteraceae bacterium]|nr:PD-(D/E)XK nuclease family protein [Acetobacteraceae bacterium]